MNNKKIDWIRCPVCGSKTRDRIRQDTVLGNYPLYCPKCKNETLIKAENNLDKTAYVVEVHFSATNTQSVEDKLKRVILHDLEHRKQGKSRKSPFWPKYHIIQLVHKNA